MTKQISERLIFNGQAFSMAFCPPLPANRPRIIEIDDNTPIPEHDYILFSTACWRRYQGAWEIKDKHFYLIGLRGRYCLQGEEPLLADWFSGSLHISQGELLRQIDIKYGKVVGSEIIDNRENSNSDNTWSLNLEMLTFLILVIIVLTKCSS